MRLAAGSRRTGDLFGNDLGGGARSDARRYPAIDPLDSWSKYPSVVNPDQIDLARGILRDGTEIGQMMKVVGEEGTSIEDFLVYLKGEYVDAVYLQQDAYHDIDAATSADRQKMVFGVITDILKASMVFDDKETARRFFHQLTQTTKDWNRVDIEDPQFEELKNRLVNMVSEVTANA